MKILVCGGRDYFDAERIDRILDLVMPSQVIHGDARGFNGLVANWGAKRGVPREVYSMGEGVTGAGAGFELERIMVVKGQPQLVIAFPGASGFLVGRAQQRGVPVVEFE